MPCIQQKKLRIIESKKQCYVFALKGNQKKLFGEIKSHMSSKSKRVFSVSITKEINRGRKEKYMSIRYWVIKVIISARI